MRISFPKTLCCVTAILLVLQVFSFSVFAQETNNTNDNVQSSFMEDMNTSGYDTIKAEHGYKTIEKNPGQENSQLLSANTEQAIGDSAMGRASLDNFVKLIIPGRKTDVYGLTFSYRNYYSETGYYYNNYYKCAQYWSMNEEQTVTTITVGEFDWSLADSYIVTVDTAQGIYTTEITQDDLASAKTLSMDSSYTTANLSVPFDLTTYDYYGLSFLVYDDQGKFITDYYMNKNDMDNGYKIPSGKYKVEALGEGASNSFCLFKTGMIDVTPSSNTISFSSSDMAKVSFNQTAGNSTGKTVNIKSIGFLQNDFGTTRHVNPSYSGGTSYIYVTKGAYTKARFFANVNDDSGWKYMIDSLEIDTSAGPVTVDYDLAFKAQFIKPTLIPYGRESLEKFTITNNHGQLVPYIYDMSYNSNFKNIRLTKGSEIYEYNISSDYIDLPNPSGSGTFTVDYSTSGPLAVTPLKDSININRSSALANDASVYYDVQSSMNEGQDDYIYITARNYGTNAWTSAGGYKLVAVGGSDPLASALSYPIPAGVTIKENQGYVFEIPITAPTRGIYTTDWQMMKGTTAFGEITAPEVLVRSTSNPYLSRPISITSIEPDKASPQMTGTTIRWTCKITGGNDPVYYFKIFKGSTLVKSSTAYSSANYIDWKPTEEGTDYRALVYVKENGSPTTTAVSKSSSYFTVNVPVPIVITSLVPDKTSPQATGTTIRWTCNITGGNDPVYYFKVYNGSTLLQSSSAYSAANYFDWTPTEAGTDYRVMVYVKENGASSTTAITKFSSYFTVNVPTPIVISSLLPNKASPQATGTTIRWTCNITGGSNPVYYFKVFNDSTLVKSSPTYVSTNYIDWTPSAVGSKYRVMVYVKENGASSTTAVTKMSDYYTAVSVSPISITSLVPNKTSPQQTGTTIRWTCNITGGSNPVYSFKVFNGSTLIKSSPAYSTINYMDWTPGAAGSKYRVMVYVKENGASSTTAVTKISSYYTVTAATAPIAITSLAPDKTSPQEAGTAIRWTCNITGGSNPVYYFKVFNGSTLIQTSSAYTSVNYVDWTPGAAGSKYRVMVYVKENGASSTTAVTKMSGYYTIN